MYAPSLRLWEAGAVPAGCGFRRASHFLPCNPSKIWEFSNRIRSHNHCPAAKLLAMLVGQLPPKTTVIMTSAAVRKRTIFLKSITAENVMHGEIPQRLQGQHLCLCLSLMRKEMLI